jgi:hypothetical protein
MIESGGNFQAIAGESPTCAGRCRALVNAISEREYGVGVRRKYRDAIQHHDSFDMSDRGCV